MDLRLATLPLILCACGSFSTLGRARTIDAGTFEIVAAPGIIGAVNGDDVAVMPRVEAQLAYGATPELELDLKLWYAGVSVGARAQLVRGELDLALAPAVSFFPVDRMAIDLPLLGGWNVGEHQLILSIRPTYVLEIGERPISWFFLGGSFAVAVAVDSRVSLIPELTVSAPVAQPEGYGTPAGTGALVQLTLAIAVRP
jgi:hypothetical protein